MSTHSKDFTFTSVFDIFLIQEEICKHLTLRDIRRCCLVSRNLYQNFTPYLYHTINITRKSTFNLFCRQESLSALYKHRDHVSEVTCYFAQIWEILLKNQCFKLTVIKSPSLKKRHQNQITNMLRIHDVIALAQSCHNLRVLEIGCFPYDGSVVDTFCKAIRDHDTLREVGIDHYGKAACTKVMLILWSGLKLERLSIKVLVDSNFTTISDLIKYRDILDEMVEQEKLPNRLKTLVVNGRIQINNQFAFIEFLKRCPHVTRLGVPWLSSLFDIPNVQHLDLSSQTLSSGPSRHLIESCEILTSIVGGTGSFPNSAIPSMFSKHCETLQEMDLTLSRSCSPHLPFFFSSFPKLKTLKLMAPYSRTTGEKETVNSPVLDINILSQNKEPWVCKNLRTLALWYTSTIDSIEDSNSGGRNDYSGILPEALYSNIGELTELRVLWLGHVDISEVDHFISRETILEEDLASGLNNDHRDRHSGLQKLRGLSKLENLQLRRMRNYFTKDNHEDIKKARVYWPSLERMLIT